MPMPDVAPTGASPNGMPPTGAPPNGMPPPGAPLAATLDQDRLRRALAHARVAVFAYRPAAAPAGGTWRWSGADFGVTGIAAADGPRHLLAALAAADRDRLRDLLGPGAAGRDGEFRLARPDGRVVHLAVQARAAAGADEAGGDDADGEAPAAILGTVRDVTGTRHATEAAASEAPAEAATDQAGLRLAMASLDAGPLAIAIADATQPDLPLIHVNQMFSRLTGYAAAEAVGRNCRFLQGPATDPAVVADIRAALAAGRHIAADLVNYRKDGTAFLNRLAIDPIHDDRGALTGFLATQMDATGPAEHPEDEHPEAGRQDAFAPARGIAGIAHAMNNLLQPVTLLGQDVIDRGLVTAAGRAHFDALVTRGRDARRLIDDLLAAARRGGGGATDLQQGATAHGLDPDH